MMQEQSPKYLKKTYFTLLLTTAVVYFFLAFLWPLFAPFIVAFLILVAVEPGLSKWSKRLGVGRKPLAYIFIVLTIAGITVSVWFGLVPYLKECDFGWCEELLAHPWVSGFVVYLQENGLGTVAEWSTTILQIGSRVLFDFGAYGLFVFLLAGVFSGMKERMEQHREGRLIFCVSRDVVDYLKAYFKTQGKLSVIISVLCIPVLSISGIQGGWALGLLTGVLDFFPVLGVGFVLIPVALWKFLVREYLTGIICIVLFIVCTVVREFLEPKFLGQAMKLPAIGIWISVYAGLQLFGTSGILKGPIGYLLICTIHRRWMTNDEKP